MKKFVTSALMAAFASGSILAAPAFAGTDDAVHLIAQMDGASVVEGGDANGSGVFNAVVDVDNKKQIASWPLGGPSGNFPLAVDAVRQDVLVAFRSPARLAIFDLSAGRTKSIVDTCEDADDVFIDKHRGRVYVSCGEGPHRCWRPYGIVRSRSRSTLCCSARFRS